MPVIDRILIQCGMRRERIAMLAGDRLVELAMLETGAGLPVDSICLGRVRRVDKPLDAAFVALDGHSDGMLAARDAPGARRRPIGARVHEGQALMVQLRRMARDDKGPRLTARPQLTGRYLAYQPAGGEPQLSGRITGDGRRRKLTALLAELAGDGGAFTARTAAADAGEEAIRDEAARLQDDWRAIAEAADAAKPPAVLWRPDPWREILATHLTDHVVEIAVSEQVALPRLKALLDELSPALSPRAAAHRGRDTLFEASGVEAQVETAAGARVDLPSGGSVVIEPTAALTAIDVNAGAVSAQTAAARVAVETNMEAVAEIAAQLRLRDVGGLVVVDFLRMHGRGETRRLMQVFTDALAEDRAETRIAGLSELGLVEMTRQRLGHGLSAWQAARRPLDDPPDLSGLAEAALERALAAAASGSSARLELRAAPVLLEALGADGAALCEAFRDRTGCTLAFVPEPGFAPGRTEVAPV